MMEIFLSSISFFDNCKFALPEGLRLLSSIPFSEYLYHVIYDAFVSIFEDFRHILLVLDIIRK